jgi:CRP/FNR family transcriptional regulator, cyclic AMP receptor protein
MPATADDLAEVPLFVDLDDKERALLAERVDLVKVEKGKLLFTYGDPGDWMGVVRKGEVEMSVRTKTGETVFLERAEVGDIFGEISLLDNGARTATAIVIEAGEILVVDRGDLDELLSLKPRAALKLLGATGKRLRQTAEILRNTASRNAYEAADEHLNVIQKAADWIANFSGSLTFLILHVVLFTLYILANVGLLRFGNFDPFPFGLLTMVVSLEAIILSTLLLYSQNRQAARDRVRADVEYDVNLKAELQIQHLHEKVDHIHSEILGRLDALDPHHRTPGAPAT